MFFKNLLVYRLTETFDWPQLEEALKIKQAKPCASSEMHSYGFIAPYPCDHSRRSCNEIGCYGPTAKSTFIDLWNDIYSDNESKQWKANPCVWFYEFERI